MEEEKKENQKDEDHVIFIDRLTDFPNAREKEAEKEEKAEEK